MYSTSALQTYAAQEAAAYGLNPTTFAAQIQQESGWNPNATSSAGCQGIAQICDSVSFDPTDPYASIAYMAQRMSTALTTYGGNQAAALASYNCGNGCANNWVAGIGTLPAETQTYIANILGGGSSPAGSANSSAAAPPANSFTAPSIFGASGTVFAPAALPPQAVIVIVAVCFVLLLLIAASGKAPAALKAA